AVPEGLVVLDEDGAGARASLEAGGYEVPETLAVRTGREGGLHHYFKGTLGCRNGLLPYVDVKGVGGYLILPPSLHRTGRRYEWVNEGADIASAPVWLTELMQKPRLAAPAAGIEADDDV